MTIRLLSAALVAGFLAACVASVLQFALTSPLILKAEVYEKRAEAASAGLVVLAHAGHDDPAHDGEGAEWQPGAGLPRLAFTALATLVTGVGYALLLGAALLAHAGRTGVPDLALRFALGGFLAVGLAPALGLPPELPGMEAAALGARQLWWVATALATAAGLYLAVMIGRPWAIAAGLALLVAPHVVGAPHPAAAVVGPLPAELAAQFAARSLAVALAFWATLGLGLGWAWRLFDRDGVRAA